MTIIVVLYDYDDDETITVPTITSITTFQYYTKQRIVKRRSNRNRRRKIWFDRWYTCPACSSIFDNEKREERQCSLVIHCKLTMSCILRAPTIVLIQYPLLNACLTYNIRFFLFNHYVWYPHSDTMHAHTHYFF